MKNNTPHPALIIYDRLGCTYIRRRPTHFRDPKTPAQIEARRRFVERFAQRKKHQ